MPRVAHRSTDGKGGTYRPETYRERKAALAASVAALGTPVLLTRKDEHGVVDPFQELQDRIRHAFPEGRTAPPVVAYLRSADLARLRSALRYTTAYAFLPLVIDARGQLVLRTPSEDRVLMRSTPRGPQIVGFYDSTSG